MASEPTPRPLPKLDPEALYAFLDDLFGEDFHHKQVLSIRDIEVILNTHLLEASREAQQAQRGIWKRLGTYLRHPDLRRRYRPKPPSAEEGGRSRVIWPKLFRRQIAWAVGRRCKMVQGPLGQYLSSHPDLCYETGAFLLEGKGAPLKKLSDFLCEDGFFERLPQRLVLQEAPSRLVGVGGLVPSW